MERTPPTIEVKGIRVLTTKQIAEAYETEYQIITNNYNRNSERYVEGKHFICLKGTEKAEFIKKNQNDFSSHSKAKAIYFWTEKGALLHAKSLNTDKAWEAYEHLIDFYFRIKEEPRQQVSENKQEMVPVTTTVEKIPEKISENQSQEDKRNIPIFGFKPAKRMLVDVPDNREAQRMIAELRKYLTGMDALLDVYNMYHKEEDFAAVQKTVVDMSGKISRISFELKEFKPRLKEMYA